MPGLNLLEPRDKLGIAGQWNDLGGTALEQLADVVDLFDFLGSEVAHGGAAVGLADDNAHDFELGQSRADHMSLGVEMLRQFLFEQPLAWPQPAQHNLFLEAADDAFERRERRGLRRVYFPIA